MKKIIIAVAVMFMSAAGLQAQKLAFVNTKKVLDTLPQKDSAEQRLQEMAVKFKGELAEYEQELSTRQMEYQKEAQTTGVSQSRLEMLQSIYQSVLQAYESEQKRMNEELQMQESALLMPILDEIKAAVGVVAKQKGYTTALDNSSEFVLFLSNTGDDITDAVIKYMLANPPKPAAPSTTTTTPKK